MSTMSVSKFGEDLLNCSICFDHIKDAKLLPCLHSFCQTCIQRHFEIYKLKNRGRVSCPTCRELLPVPQNNVSGFRTDTTATKTKQLLDQVLNELMATGHGDEDLMDTACALPQVDFEQLELKRNHLKNSTYSIQQALSKIRVKMMNLYLVENHVSYTMDAECKDMLSQQKKAQQNPTRVRQMVEGTHAHTMAQLAKQQDKMYQHLMELRSVNDVIEEVLDKSTPYQFQDLYTLMCGFALSVDHLLEDHSPIHVESDKLTQQFIDNLDLAAADEQLYNITPPPPDEDKPLKRNMKRKGPSEKTSFKLLYKLSGRGSQPGQFNFPVDATFTPDGGLAVCDKNNNRIQLFDSRGNLDEVCLGNKEVKPRRIRLSPRDGCWYISDEFSECVKVYSPNWKLIRRIGETTFQCPAGMAIDSQGNLIMTDAEKRFVSVHNPTTGEVLSKFYYRFLGDKLIPCPYFCCVNEDDQLIASDLRNNIIKVFSQSGKVLFKIDGLCCPRGVCVDPYGNILVAEGDRHCISMYSPYGKFIQHVLTKSDGLCFPMSLDMDLSGRLVVTQWGHYTPHEVLVFQMY